MEQVLDLFLKEAEASDAERLLDFFKAVATESEFMTLAPEGLGMTKQELEIFAETQAQTDNQLCLLLYLGEDLVGVLNIAADQNRALRHIGDVFIVVRKAYWNKGLGRILLEEGIAWAEGTNLLRKLDLSVQVRNERAIHLYQTLGFEIEGLRKRGVYKEGEYLDVYLMGKLIDGQNQ
ncbi:GNAT family N-acetyltransferase [Streptococcus australis]|uniref:GNAT family N-acetyltransferase n=1 Tax=Streptococcus australis TaxID=113107 RepID=UPI001CC02853|nr:GNAT family protein [Streptococcus australis]MBZ2153302.1 GNAT family N-acetyltransferase [Streptococcus australis]